ncbi:hypothetical protein AYO47_06950 [Planctomyces sp. SCGC AG-212-M04]|nr:hypothetical protein AYO47_06950 [Planctomyces sp. SCGC AG-212-M04]
MRTALRSSWCLTVLAVFFFLLPVNAFSQQNQSRENRSRRSQRVKPLEETVVASPDGRVKFTLLSNSERLSFKITLDDLTVVEPSPLAFTLDGNDLTAGVILQGTERSEIDEKYPWHGAKSTAINRCKVATIRLTNDLAMQDFSLEVRAFDDGVAYRVVVPGDGRRVPDERSAFVLPGGTRVWFHDMDGHYEASYKSKLAEDVGAGEWAGVPMTFALPNGAGYGSITEANLVNYSGMCLEGDGRRGFIVGLGHRQPLNYPFELRYGREEGKRLGKPAAIEGRIETPWRVVMVGRDLNALVTSDILHNLCPPADPKYFPEGMNTKWVEPGLAVWKYVDGGDGSFEGLKGFSRMGGELSAKYHVIEGVWTRWSDDQIKDIVDESNKRGVKLLFWIHSNKLRTLEEQNEFFDRLKRYGVAGAKIDFLDHEAKEIVDLYETLLEQAAKRQLVINFHGANKPTGRMRTWPNDMVREAVRGMESSKFLERASHQTTLPFTRCLAGAADYSTMIFTERRRDTTWAHQIASLATLSAPLLTMAAHPQSILDNPARDVIKTIPPVWDETRVLPPSKIGELSVFARRKGSMWMLAVMCGPEQRDVTIPLSFLATGEYRVAQVIDDPSQDASVSVTENMMRAGDRMTLHLRPGGGYLARFEPK